MNFVKKAIADNVYYNKIMAWKNHRSRRLQLAKDHAAVVKKYRLSDTWCDAAKEDISPYIWLCWWDGEDAMSPLVKGCCERIRRLNPHKEVILITYENMHEYTEFPEYILEKFQDGRITKTHMSDLLRAELLALHGGVWMDATLYTFGPVPQRAYELPIYSGRCTPTKNDYNVSGSRWTSFFPASRSPGNVLFCFLRDFWMDYWKKNNILCEYFLVDHAIALGYNYIPAIRKEIDMIDEGGCAKNLWLLLHELSMPYDENRLAKIKAENWMQKLTYKVEDSLAEKAKETPNIVYSKLFLKGS